MLQVSFGINEVSGSGLAHFDRSSCSVYGGILHIVITDFDPKEVYVIICFINMATVIYFFHGAVDI